VNERLEANLALVLASVIWGGTFVVVRQALAGTSPLLFLAARFTIAAVLLAIVSKPELTNLSERQVFQASSCS